jgi:hypothetical protein
LSTRTAATALLVGMFFLCVTGIAHAEWFADGDFNIVYDNNLSRAYDKSDRKGDSALVPHALLGQYLQLSDRLGLSLTADAAAGIYTKYQALNNVNVGMTASLKYKLGLGPYAPWLKGYASVKYFDYREDLRNGAPFITGFLAGKRIHERVNVQLGYEHESLHANNSLFDQLSDEVSVRTDLSVTSSLNLLLGYSIKKGDVAVYYSPDTDYYPSNNYYKSKDYSPSWYKTPVFLDDTFKTPMEIYKVRATTHTIFMGLDMALTDHWSAGITADFNSARSTSGSWYPDTVLRAGIHYSF